MYTSMDIIASVKLLHIYTLVFNILILHLYFFLFSLTRTLLINRHFTFVFHVYTFTMTAVLPSDIRLHMFLLYLSTRSFFCH